MTVPDIQPLPEIVGVQLVNLREFGDPRGSFSEIFRAEWFAERSWREVQANCSRTAAGSLRGLHYHHRQVDYWYVTSGTIRAGLVDLRLSSTTFRASHMIELGEDSRCGLFIPSGVAHGFAAITDATLIYVIDAYYDGQDEFGVLWDDPDISLPWGIASPVISERDKNNPGLSQIERRNLPPG